MLSTAAVAAVGDFVIVRDLDKGRKVVQLVADKTVSVQRKYPAVASSLLVGKPFGATFRYVAADGGSAEQPAEIEKSGESEEPTGRGSWTRVQRLRLGKMEEEEADDSSNSPAADAVAPVTNQFLSQEVNPQQLKPEDIAALKKQGLVGNELVRKIAESLKK